MISYSRLEWWTYSQDLNVPIAWVSAIRRILARVCGVSVAIMKDAKSLIEELMDTTKSLNARAGRWKGHCRDWRNKPCSCVRYW